jgi:hypothetical protein
LLLVAKFIEVPKRENDDPVIAELVNLFDDCSFEFLPEHHADVPMP